MNSQSLPPLYDVLGVEAHVDRAELKRAYRALAKRLHPDTPPMAATSPASAA